MRSRFYNIPEHKYRNNPSKTGNPDGNHIVPQFIFSMIFIYKIFNRNENNFINISYQTYGNMQKLIIFFREKFTPQSRKHFSIIHRKISQYISNFD